MNTKDGKPNWYNDLRTGATQTFASASPSITLSGTGFSGLDGSYYATVYNGDFVLVTKTGSYTIYFSNSATAPACVKSGSINNNGNKLLSVLYPNPFNETVNIKTADPDLINRILITDELGKPVKEINKSLPGETISFGSDLPSGIYLIKVFAKTSIETYKIIKE
jgi:hypothetical protein